MKISRGTIFDIQRFSLQDGPGIRTTIFLKGCPLRCVWCHNPESWSFEARISYNANMCRSCMACTGVCSRGAHKAVDGRHELNHDLCNACRKCVKACSYYALKMVGDTMTVDEVVDIVFLDKDFFINSGGGATISGGEPMAQFEFTLELLKGLKSAGIHICLETCGYAPRESFSGVLPYVDMFLYDYKATDSLRHEEFTGVSNALTLSNLDFLYLHGASIVLRCPLVPGVNDSENHLKGIADLCEKYPDLVGVEIMAYHDLGVKKAKQAGEKSVLTGLKTTDEETEMHWLEILKNYGCHKAIIG